MRRCSAIAIAGGLAPVLSGNVREGRIHSVFAHAVNVLLAPDAMLALTTPPAARVPNGVELVTPRTDGSGLLGLRPTLTVEVGDGRIRVPDAGLEIQTSTAVVWDPRPQLGPHSVDPTVVVEQLARLGDILCAQAQSKGGLAPLLMRSTRRASLDSAAGGTGSTFIRRAAPAVDTLVHAIGHGCMVEIRQATQALAGLGPGLTPSGDDFLVGVCAMLFLAAAIDADEAFTAYCADTAAGIVDGTDGRTTLLSSIWLHHAARGEFSAELGALILSLASRRHSLGLERAASGVLAIGASSGFDTALGLLMAGQAALSRYQREPVWP